eukprot:4210165-Prymnesium_polylepis.1
MRAPSVRHVHDGMRVDGAMRASDASTNPNSLRELYKVGDVAAVSGRGVQSVVSFLGDAIRIPDLQQFLAEYAPGANHHIAKVLGPQDTSKCEDPDCTESMLDSEYLMSICLLYTSPSPRDAHES